MSEEDNNIVNQVNLRLNEVYSGLWKTESKKLSTRSRNVLRSLEGANDLSPSFFTALFSLDINAVCKIRNCGKKTAEELLSFVELFSKMKDISLASFEPVYDIPKDTHNQQLPDYIEEFKDVIFSDVNKLSTRSKNVINGLLDSCDNSVVDFYRLVTDDNFSVLSLRNVGKGCADEVSGAILVIKKKIDNLSSANEGICKEVLLNHSLRQLYHDEGVVNHLLAFKQDRGFFPVFLAIQEYVNHLQSLETRVIYNGIRLFHGYEPNGLRDVAEQVNYSFERIRQIRDSLFNKLISLFDSLKKINQGKACNYTCFMHDLQKDILAQEGVNFDKNFIHWVIGSIFEDYTCVGDPHRTLTSSFSKRGFLALVPTSLVVKFDFSGFINNLDSIVERKKTEEYAVSLEELIHPYQKFKYVDEYEALDKTCRSIIFNHYNIDIDYGKVLFKANKQKTLPEIFYEIIQNNGKPMSKEQIYEEFSYLYPERFLRSQNISGGLFRHPDIISIGRSGIYTLREWMSDSIYVGSIRDLTCELLDTRDVPLASLQEVIDYVKKFRPESNDKSILTNLFQDSSKKFSKYKKIGEKGVKYIGYSGRKYDSSIIRLAIPHKLSVDEVITRLEAFLANNYHFPYSSGVGEEEIRLNRYMRRKRKEFENGLLSQQDADKWESFENKYKEHNNKKTKSSYNQRAF